MITSDKRLKVFARDEYLCQVCGKHISVNGSPQLAHRIRQGKQAEKHCMIYIWNKYNKDRSHNWCKDFIIDSDLNLLSTCSLECNSRCNIFFKSIERDNLIDEIIEQTECLKYEKIY